MKISDMMETFLIVLAALFVLLLIVLPIILKQNKEKKVLEDALTPEQKSRLYAAQPLSVKGEKGGFVIEGLVVRVKDKGAKYLVNVMWHNMVIPNNCYNGLMMAYVRLSRETVESHSLKVGDWVTYWMNPQKQKWEILF